MVIIICVFFITVALLVLFVELFLPAQHTQIYHECCALHHIWPGLLHSYAIEQSARCLHGVLAAVNLR
jgi:hypothetical protein